MSIPMKHVGVSIISQLSSPIYYLHTVKVAILSDGIWLLVILIRIPMVIIRDGEYLVLGHLGSFIFCFSLNGVRKFCLFQLVSWQSVVFGIYFYNTGRRSFDALLRASVIKSHTVLWTGGARKQASVCNEEDLGSIPGLGWSPGEGKGYPLQYLGLENSMNFIAEGVRVR